ncbi:MAG: alpha-ribazole phosphatase family protein [Acidiferrobacterales bacterium]|nr:alpha-ribazole phosphatase family protein [Acidiferrobacterales bacterium]
MESHTPPPLFDLLRHGKTESADIFRGHTEDPLSAEGWEQMEKVVANCSWDQIICSPLSRCRLFASDLAEKTNTPLFIDQQFAEYHFGDWDGRRYQEVMETDGALVTRFFDDPFNHTPPNAEEFSVFHERVKQGWESALTAFQSQSVLIITHGGVIMSVIAHVLGLDRVHGKIDVGYANLTRVRPGLADYPHRLVAHGDILPRNETED